MPRFKGLQAFLKGKLGVEAVFEYGALGDFEVFANGTLVFSKAKEGSYPSPPAVLAAIEALGA
ncbi:Selenoprotein W [Spironucleus salmonicida]|nr:Selenoprotein W [Spironucleus salmonicida]